MYIYISTCSASTNFPILKYMLDMLKYMRAPGSEIPRNSLIAASKFPFSPCSTPAFHNSIICLRDIFTLHSNPIVRYKTTRILAS